MTECQRIGCAGGYATVTESRLFQIPIRACPSCILDLDFSDELQAISRRRYVVLARQRSVLTMIEAGMYTSVEDATADAEHAANNVLAVHDECINYLKRHFAPRPPAKEPTP